MTHNNDPKPRSEGKNSKKGKEMPYSSKHIRIQKALLEKKTNKK
jgi:hypothetical protein